MLPELGRIEQDLADVRQRRERMEEVYKSTPEEVRGLATKLIALIGMYAPALSGPQERKLPGAQVSNGVVVADKDTKIGDKVPSALVWDENERTLYLYGRVALPLEGKFVMDNTRNIAYLPDDWERMFDTQWPERYWWARTPVTPDMFVANSVVYSFQSRFEALQISSLISGAETVISLARRESLRRPAGQE